VFACDGCGRQLGGGLSGFEVFASCRDCDEFDLCLACVAADQAAGAASAAGRPKKRKRGRKADAVPWQRKGSAVAYDASGGTFSGASSGAEALLVPSHFDGAHRFRLVDRNRDDDDDDDDDDGGGDDAGGDDGSDDDNSGGGEGEERSDAFDSDAVDRPAPPLGCAGGSGAADLAAAAAADVSMVETAPEAAAATSACSLTAAAGAGSPAGTVPPGARSVDAAGLVLRLAALATAGSAPAPGLAWPPRRFAWARPHCGGDVLDDDLDVGTGIVGGASAGVGGDGVDGGSGVGGGAGVGGGSHDEPGLAAFLDAAGADAGLEGLCAQLEAGRPLLARLLFSSTVAAAAAPGPTAPSQGETGRTDVTAEANLSVTLCRTIGGRGSAEQGWWEVCLAPCGSSGGSSERGGPWSAAIQGLIDALPGEIARTNRRWRRKQARGS